MVCIFASGTRYAALISGLAISATPITASATAQATPITTSAAAQAAKKHDITISIAGLRNQRGQILVCVTARPKAFPDCSKDTASVRRAVKPVDAGSFRVTVPAAGTYAIALVHDENSNGKMDKALFLPKEGFGFSRNPTITTGPPRFTSASFAVDGSQSQHIKMRYML